MFRRYSLWIVGILGVAVLVFAGWLWPEVVTDIREVAVPFLAPSPSPSSSPAPAPAPSPAPRDVRGWSAWVHHPPGAQTPIHGASVRVNETELAVVCLAESGRRRLTMLWQGPGRPLAVTVDRRDLIPAGSWTVLTGDSEGRTDNSGFWGEGSWTHRLALEPMKRAERLLEHLIDGHQLHIITGPEPRSHILPLSGAGAVLERLIRRCRVLVQEKRKNPYLELPSAMEFGHDFGPNSVLVSAIKMSPQTSDFGNTLGFRTGVEEQGDRIAEYPMDQCQIIYDLWAPTLRPTTAIRLWIQHVSIDRRLLLTEPESLLNSGRIIVDTACDDIAYAVISDCRLGSSIACESLRVGPDPSLLRLYRTPPHIPCVAQPGNLHRAITPPYESLQTQDKSALLLATTGRFLTEGNAWLRTPDTPWLVLDFDIVRRNDGSLMPIGRLGGWRNNRCRTVARTLSVETSHQQGVACHSLSWRAEPGEQLQFPVLHLCAVGQAKLHFNAPDGRMSQLEPERYHLLGVNTAQVVKRPLVPLEVFGDYSDPDTRRMRLAQEAESYGLTYDRGVDSVTH